MAWEKLTSFQQKLRFSDKKSGLNKHDDILLPIPPLGEFFLRAHPATNLSRPPKRKLTQGSRGIPAGECACWGCPKRPTCGRLKNSGAFTGLTHTPYMFVSSIANVVPRFKCYFMEAILSPGLRGEKKNCRFSYFFFGKSAC